MARLSNIQRGVKMAQYSFEDMMRLGMLGLVSLGVAACSGSGSPPAAERSGSSNNDQAAVETVDAALAQCRTCHTFDEGEPHRVGPNLWDVYGKPAGQNPDYAYSTALEQSGLVWDEETLDTYLENPRAKVPGGKMSYAGMRDADRRAKIIAFLKERTPSEQ